MPETNVCLGRDALHSGWRFNTSSRGDCGKILIEYLTSRVRSQGKEAESGLPIGASTNLANVRAVNLKRRTILPALAEIRSAYEEVEISIFLKLQLEIQ
jgi:hypothetical protein